MMLQCGMKKFLAVVVILVLVATGVLAAHRYWPTSRRETTTTPTKPGAWCTPYAPGSMWSTPASRRLPRCPVPTTTTQPPVTTTSQPHCIADPGSDVCVGCPGATCHEVSQTGEYLPPTPGLPDWGPVGLATGNVEYVCYQPGNDPENYSGMAAIAATMENGTPACPSSVFDVSGSIPVGYDFYCQDVEEDNLVGGPYRSTIGDFEVPGVPGDFYGAYCANDGNGVLTEEPVL